MNTPLTQLHHLANLYGINTSYLDMDNRIRIASSSALLSMLKALEAPVDTVRDIPSAIREKKLKDWQQPVEPVIVVWENDILTVNLRLPATTLNFVLTATLYLENGDERKLDWRISDSSVLDSRIIEGARYVTTQLCLPDRLPAGYHRMILEIPGQTVESLIISSPVKAFNFTENMRIWGLFLPLYALRTKQNWGAGEYSDLEKLIEWTAGMGGRLVGTLPLLPSFFDEQFGPSPYTPVSRQFWNELYISIEKIPELNQCPQAQEWIGSTEVQQEIAALRNTRRVDYLRLLKIKRKALEKLSTWFFSQQPARFSNLQEYTAANKAASNYARFRAAGERHGICWYEWPQKMRDGQLGKSDYSEETERYYLYSQWLASEQMEDLFRKARENGVHLYMDLPLGVHPFGYDVWREVDSFIRGVCGGAPPDPVFTSGQNWMFPPLHPENIRRNGYRYLINSLRHQLRLTGMLRIDHMMHFHRLFCIPEGVETRDGVYLKYHADEMYAILTLESFRNKSIVIGEDLGMVPPEVRPKMNRHGIYRMFVGQYQLIAENRLGEIPARSIASLNTHDMFPFASFWNETDILERQKLKLIDENTALRELEQRRQIKRTLLSILQYRDLVNTVTQDTQATMRAIFKLLATSPAFAFLINLEDLWLETHPQNVPGTHSKQNWSRKARYTFEQFSRSAEIRDQLGKVDRDRKSAGI